MQESQIVAEVDLSAVSHNVRALKEVVGPGVGLMAVAKSNGYGHGAVEIAKTALESGADFIGVARFDEAMVLRQGGVTGPILIFGHTRTERARQLADHDLTQTACSREYAQRLSQSAALAGKRVSVHLKLDTGMGRLGILHEHYQGDNADSHRTASDEIRHIATLPGVKLTGIYTHFSASDAPENRHNNTQIELFKNCLDTLGPDAPPAHAANGAAIFFFPESRHQMVRAGSLVYGLCPPELMGIAPHLIPAMTLKTRIVQLKHIPEGFKLGYDCSWTAKRPTTIATVPLGYGDGYTRLFSNNGAMLVRGTPAPIAGKVCMDMTMLDVTDIEGVQEGDEVVIFGKQGDAELSAQQLADTIGTIPEEIIVGLTARVPRIYINRNEAIRQAV